MSKYIMAIDGGTQSTKVLIFDETGSVVAEGRQPLRPMVSPKPEWAVHPEDDLWDALVVACKKAFENFTGDPKDIVGVGLCTIRTCRVFLKEDGSLAYPVISWMDPRAYGPVTFPAEDVKYVTTTTGYFTQRLTGEFKDTVAENIYWQWPTDPMTWEWSEDDKVFESFNLRRDQVMELKKPGDILGYVQKDVADLLGMPEGLPVVATGNDKAVEALGTGLMTGNSGLISLGTYSTGMLKCPNLLEDPKTYWPNFAAVPFQYLFETLKGIHRGMWTISWMAELLGEGLKAEADKRGVSVLQILNEEAAQVPAGSQGLITVPEWLVAASDEVYKKGIMIGFDVRHKKEHMFRSLMEGIILKLYNGFSDMCNEVDIFPDRLIASGGGSKGDTFVQILADVFGLPVVRNKVEDAAGTGAAILTAVATGVYPDFDTATKKMVHVKETFTPNMENHKLYMELNKEVFRDLTKATDSILKKTYPLFKEQ